LAIPDTGRPDKIYGLVLVFFAAGRPYNSMNADEIDRIEIIAVRLSVIGCRLSVIGYRLSSVGASRRTNMMM
jgi:hypothetical protein